MAASSNRLIVEDHATTIDEYIPADPRRRTHSEETEGQRDERKDERTDARIDKRSAGRTEGWTDGIGMTEGRIEGQREGRMEGQREGRMEGRLEGRPEGPTDGQTICKKVLQFFGWTKNQTLAKTTRWKERQLEKIDKW